MTRTLRILLTLIALAGPVSAHHSPTAFDRTTIVSLRGEVMRYDWQNPHVYIVVTGTDGAGRTGEWLIEADPTPLMVRSGWSAATLTPGDSVSIRMWPDRDAQQRHGQLMSLITADGVTLGRRDAPAPAVAPVASSIAGVWDALPHFGVPIIDQDVNPPRTYTAAGLAAKAAFDLTQHPMASCVAYPTPLLTVVPYLNEIEIHADRVLIKNELNSIVRTVYTDGREHPANGERSNQGHSIGWWDDDVLVVDTRLFADYRLAHGVGVPSGAQKHTVERFALNTDGTALEIEIVVEDPEFVVAPYTVTTTWDHAPDKAPQPFACNAENARLFTVR